MTPGEHMSERMTAEELLKLCDEVTTPMACLGPYKWADAAVTLATALRPHLRSQTPPQAQAVTLPTENEIVGAMCVKSTGYDAGIDTASLYASAKNILALLKPAPTVTPLTEEERAAVDLNLRGLHSHFSAKIMARALKRLSASPTVPKGEA
jgi:hypothetical protein